MTTEPLDSRRGPITPFTLEERWSKVKMPGLVTRHDPEDGNIAGRVGNRFGISRDDLDRAGRF